MTSPRTGRVVVAQPPNLSLTLAMLSIAAGWVWPTGTAGEVAHWAAAVTLTWWAGDEVLRGHSPFRRVLGVVVLAFVVAPRVAQLLA